MNIGKYKDHNKMFYVFFGVSAHKEKEQIF